MNHYQTRIVLPDDTPMDNLSSEGKMKPNFLNSKQASSYLGITRNYLYILISLKLIPAMKRGGKGNLCFFKDDLDNYLARKS